MFIISATALRSILGYPQESSGKMKIKNNSIWDVSIRYILLVAIVPLIITSILYFNISSYTTNKITYEQSSEINKQIVLNFENYINNLIDTSDYIEGQIEQYDGVYDKEILHYNFELATELQKDIENIELYDEAGMLVFEDHGGNEVLMDSKPWFTEAIFNKHVSNFSMVQSTDGKESEVIALSKYISYYAEGREKKGVLRIDINFNRIEELINITDFGDRGGLLFVDENNRVVFSTSNDKSEYNIEEIKEKVIGEYMTKIGGQSMYVSINTIANTRWRIVTYLNRNFLAEIKNNYLIYFLIILLLSNFMAIRLTFSFTKRLTNPIEKLKDTLLAVEPRDLKLEINEEDYEEIQVLNRSINKMSKRINNLMQSVIKEQEEKAELELDILQHQINPHFLYNTLDTIVVLSENDRKQDVINTIIALSKYFRINLSGGNKYITVAKELEQIDNYLKIQKARYQQRFEYEIQVDDRILDYEVLKLIIQPIVENAIYHGTSAYEESNITIKHEIVDDNYFFRVVNSGYGLTDEQIEEIHMKMKEKSKGKSVGLKNVYSRLKLHYGKESDLFFEVDDESNTIVSIKIPLDQLKRTKV